MKKRGKIHYIPGAQILKEPLSPRLRKNLAELEENPDAEVLPVTKLYIAYQERESDADRKDIKDAKIVK